MPLQKIYALHQLLREEDSVFTFKGVVTQDLLAYVLEIMEDNFLSDTNSIRIRKKVYGILIECIQNLYYHKEYGNLLDLNREITDSALLIVSRKKNAYEIKTGNYILNKNTSSLGEKIDFLNKLTKLELRDLYRSTLINGEMSQKGGAGLGLIDIARKSGNKLEYDFLPLDDKFSFFCLNIKIQ